MEIDPSEYPSLQYFSQAELEQDFACRHSGKHGMQPGFLLKLDKLRHHCQFPFRISSGYRHFDPSNMDVSHPREWQKISPGQHAYGRAADVRISNGKQRRMIVEQAIALGFNGIGVARTFVHVDNRSSDPVMWAY